MSDCDRHSQILTRLALNLQCLKCPQEFLPRGQVGAPGLPDRWGCRRVSHLSLKQFSGQEIGQMWWKRMRGRRARAPNPRVAGSRTEVSRGDAGNALPARAKRGARVLRAKAGSGVGAGTRPIGYRVPRQPRGSPLQLAGRSDRPTPLTLTVPRGLGRDSARAGAGRRRRSGGEGEAAHWAPPGLRSAASGRKWCQPCPSHAARRRVRLALPLSIEVQRGRLAGGTPAGGRVDEDS